MAIFDLMATSTVALVAITFLFSLMIGSFLNVVIHRLPIMLERSWTAQCQELLNPEEPSEQTERYNLITPNSCCPQCKSPIKAWQNIPVINYLILGGKCANCKTAISIRYPIVELATALLSVIVVLQMGFSWQSLALLFFTWTLISLTMIDVDHQLLPDNLTLPLLWAGLIVNSQNLFVSLPDALWGAVFGYLSLWSIYWLFKLLTGKEGMGYGDFKLLAALGAWLGWQMLPVIIILSSLVGAVVGIALIAFRNHSQSIPIPFGPYLAAAGWLAAFWGQDITQAYLRFSGL